MQNIGWQSLKLHGNNYFFLVFLLRKIFGIRVTAFNLPKYLNSVNLIILVTQLASCDLKMGCGLRKVVDWDKEKKIFRR